MIQRFVTAGMAAMAAAGIGASDLTATAQQMPVEYEVQGDFAGKKAGKTALDLSGVACMPPRADGSRLCLFVNDESRHAQFGTIEGRTITPGDILPLIGKRPGEATLGTPPAVLCPNGEAEFGEFDGEGVAYAEPYFYIVGSHGCSRKGGEIRLSSFILARVRVDAEGRPVGADGEAIPEDEWRDGVETTYRLSDFLMRAGKASDYFVKTLDEAANGLNIEGMAVDGDRLLFGLRAPSLGGSAFLVAAPIASLFRAGNAPADEKPEIIPLALGEGVGIRDLASLPDGRLLVLAGPAQTQPLPYSLFLAEPQPGGALTRLVELPPLQDTDDASDDDEEASELDVPKAEAITVLGIEGGELRVLVLYDGVENGAPRELRVTLP